MKGKILDFSVQDQTGLILGDNQQRYTFDIHEWKDPLAPVRGLSVDFEVNSEQQATAIYLDLHQQQPSHASQPLGSDSNNTLQQHDSSQLNPSLLSKFEQAENHYRQTIITCFKKFADFKGRARRREFWYFELFCVLLSVVLSLFSDSLATLAMLFTFIPNLAVSVRRLHDIGRSGWWMLLVFIPIIGILWLLFWATQEGTTDSNQYGESPKN